MAQSDARPTGDQAPGVRQLSFVGIGHEIILYAHSLPSADSRGQLSVSGEGMCTSTD